MAIKINGEVTFEGLVLETREFNGYDDSDFYAVVWDLENNCPKKTMYDTTRFGGGGMAEVDASEEIKEKYRLWWDELSQLASEAKELDKKSEELKASLLPQKGDDVVVIKGKKIAKGTRGKVFWVGENSFGTKKAGMSPAEGAEFDEKGFCKNPIWIPLSYLRKESMSEEEIKKIKKEIKRLDKLFVEKSGECDDRHYSVRMRSF